MSKHLKTTPVLIPIERLTICTWIKLPEFNWLVVVEDIDFDGGEYELTVTEKDCRFVDERDWREVSYVRAGKSVEFAGIGEPDLRAENSIEAFEWEAKADAIEAGNLELQGRLNAAQGHVCQPIDERPLMSAVAEAIGVPALMAAE